MNKSDGWVLPKGTVEEGEEYSDTALREVLEESGASATIMKYIGKSNIISFFKMLSFMMSGRFEEYVARAGSNQTILHFGSKKTPSISAKLRFENSKSYDEYEFTLTTATPNRLIIKDETITWGRKENELKPQTIQLKSNFTESGLVDTKDKTALIIRNILDRGCKVYQFHDSSNEGPLRQASPVNSANYLQAEGNNLASFLYLLKQNYPIEYKRIVNHVKMVVPQFRDFYLEPQNNYISLNWVDTSLNDYVFNSHQLSDGSIRFIALATLLLQPNKIMPNVIIIDEPELGLHPYAIDLLAEMIKDASLHTQIIIATQSSALIDNFDVDNITVIERDEDKGCTIANKLNNKKLQEWLDEYSNSELWSKNVIGGRPI